jgi:hypothetical protein
MQQRYDLVFVGLAGLAIGFLIGADQQPEPLAAESSGMSIVQRVLLERIPAPVPIPPLLVSERSAPPPALAPLPPVQTTPGERALLQAPPPARDSCAPGKREEFWYRHRVHWRCRYGQ